MTREEIDGLAWERSGGLLPAIVQDAATGRVRMLGWMDRGALETTLASGRATFFSRSRRAQWTKGESSGNVLEVLGVVADCDRDALLVRARAHGPTCHTGSESCFEGNAAPEGAPTLARLEETIRDRLARGGETSYTARLAAGGVAHVAQKVGEEGVETALAAVTGDRGALVGEAADLVYHLLVLLAASGVGFAAVLAELERRAEGER
jgi:phosphoribosyl-ATP pyrophosphohydrolase/phosphoribosyl-AMP cyclohydrolase